ncbi:MAG: transglutaminase domain-containing protein, partial [Geopsychrobacter sp.]|nr:transglutaminase domain-containing protein [Geopsychrobacter sp.]
MRISSCCSLFVVLLGLMALLLLPSSAMAGSNSLEKGLIEDLVAIEKIAIQIQQKQTEGKSFESEMQHFKMRAEAIDVTNLLLGERYRLRSERARIQGGSALERQERMGQLYRDAVQELRLILQQIVDQAGVTATDLEELQTIIRQIVPAKQSPLLGALPYRQLNYPPRQPLYLPTITPAYRDINASVVAADLSGAPEAPVSKDIAVLAQSLSWSPVAIYEWVKNNIETEWYWGGMKGAEETLRQGSGNDADQAALLVAMMRAANYPARYVRGVVEFFPKDLAKITNLTGVENPQKIGELFQRAGIPFEAVMSGLDIVNYRVEHFWVEVQVPYSNYRGILSDAQGKVWLPLDTSIKVTGYNDNPSPLDLYSEAGNPLPALRGDYLGTTQVSTPLELLATNTQSFLDLNFTGTFFQDLLVGKTLVSENLHILPANLQFKTITITGEYTQLPDGLIHKARFQIPGQSVEDALDVTLPVYGLSNRRIFLSYEPETVEDQEIINAWGGLDNTPSYLVHLRPVLLIDDQRIAVGSDGYAVGTDFSFSIELQSPNGV